LQEVSQDYLAGVVVGVVEGVVVDLVVVEVLVDVGVVVFLRITGETELLLLAEL
jgi:F0F1-type ATP synthase assembly protein I